MIACAVYISVYMLRTLGGSEAALAGGVFLFPALGTLFTGDVDSAYGPDLEAGALFVGEP